MSTILFGFDLVALVSGVIKIVADAFELSANVVRAVTAISTGLIVVVVGLQTNGVIFGPETEQWVVLALSAVSAMLAVYGYGREVWIAVVAVYDLARMKALSGYGAMVASATTDAGVAKRTLSKAVTRYGFEDLFS